MVFFKDTATTEIYTLSLHDALPICARHRCAPGRPLPPADPAQPHRPAATPDAPGHLRLERSEEHTSELQSRQYLVCRLLLEKLLNSVTAFFLVHLSLLDYPFCQLPS